MGKSLVQQLLGHKHKCHEEILHQLDDGARGQSLEVFKDHECWHF